MILMWALLLTITEDKSRKPDVHFVGMKTLTSYRSSIFRTTAGGGSGHWSKSSGSSFIARDAGMTGHCGNWGSPDEMPNLQEGTGAGDQDYWPRRIFVSYVRPCKRRGSHGV